MADLRKRLSELTKELAFELPVLTVILLEFARNAIAISDLSTIASPLRGEIPAVGLDPAAGIQMLKSADDLRDFDDLPDLEDYHRQYRKVLSDITPTFVNLSDDQVQELEKKWTPELDRQIAELTAGFAKLTLSSKEDMLALFSFIERRAVFLKSITQETGKALNFIGEILAILEPQSTM